MQQTSKKKWVPWLCIAVTAFLTLLFTTRNSPLYPDNAWVDAQAFYTMGRGWVHGLIPYRDLFEQKGPLLYLIYAVGYLIDSHGFTGVFILEVINMTFAGYWMYKCCSCLLDKTRALVSALSLIIFLTCIGQFAYGGSAEEFLFAPFFYSLYCFIQAVQENRISRKRLFLNGLMAGLVTVVKFNLLGFWFAWMMLVFFGFCAKKQWKEGILACLIFLAGMALPVLAFMLYFYAVGALKEFIDAYFLFNAINYTRTNGSMLIYKLVVLMQTAGKVIARNFPVLLFILFGIGWLWFRSKKLAVCILVQFLFTCLGIYIGGVAFWYYFLIPALFSIFACMGVIELISTLPAGRKKSQQQAKQTKQEVQTLQDAKTIQSMQKSPADLSLSGQTAASIRQAEGTEKSHGSKQSPRTHSSFTNPAAWTGLLAVFFACGLINSPNAFTETFMMPKSERWYAPMVEYMKQFDSNVLLNYGCLDTGLYTQMDQDPFMRYYMRQNVAYGAYPEIMDSQWQALKEGIPDFVIVKFKTSMPYNPYSIDHHLLDYYHEVMKASQDTVTYVLYQKNGLESNPEKVQSAAN